MNSDKSACTAARAVSKIRKCDLRGLMGAPTTRPILDLSDASTIVESLFVRKQSIEPALQRHCLSEELHLFIFVMPLCNFGAFDSGWQRMAPYIDQAGSEFALSCRPDQLSGRQAGT